MADNEKVEAGSDNGGAEDSHMLVKMLDEIDALKFAKLDAEMKSLMMELETAQLRLDRSVLELKLKELQHQVFAYQTDTMKKEINARVVQTNSIYNAVVKKIATDHGIKDHKKMLIDPDAFTVRELGVDVPLPEGE